MDVMVPEWTVFVPLILFQFALPLICVCIAAYFGARKGAERALRDKRDNEEPSS